MIKFEDNEDLDKLLDELFLFQEVEIEIDSNTNFGHRNNLKDIVSFIHTYFSIKLEVMCENNDIGKKHKELIEQRISNECPIALSILELCVTGYRDKQELIDDLFLLDKNKDMISLVSYFLKKRKKLKIVI